MKALQRVVWSLIFLVFGVHMVNAEEQVNQVQQRIEKDLCGTHQGDFRWKRMHAWGNCEWKWDERALCLQQKEKRNSQGKDPRTFEETVEKWRVQKKRKEKKWKEKKKKKDRKNKAKYRRS